MEENDVVRSLAALAQPVRLQVFRALVVRGATGLTPGTMAEASNIPPNTLSFHLKELTHAGLVTQERSSRNIIYRAAFERMNACSATSPRTVARARIAPSRRRPRPAAHSPYGEPMKRFHVHAHVEDLKASVAFYSKLFAAEPTRLESDYAKWMIEDPRINFAISTRGGKPGVDHLGFQTDTDEELAELKARAQAADLALLDEGETTCCYARSEKHWVTDPQGIAWEHFHTLDSIPTFSEPRRRGAPRQPAAARRHLAASRSTLPSSRPRSCC